MGQKQTPQGMAGNCIILSILPPRLAPFIENLSQLLRYSLIVLQQESRIPQEFPHVAWQSE